MFSYRHVFHAGNHADVLKHVVLVQTLLYASQKETPFFYIDTHAGAGVYSLQGAQAQKSGEAESGISRLWNQKKLPAAIQSYLKLIQELNANSKLQFYPGSPYIAEKILREQDKLRLYELHPTESQILEKNFQQLVKEAEKKGIRQTGRGKRIIIEKKDGFATLKALLPPVTRRAVVLIDPPYEDKTDYQKVIDTITESLTRFPTGTYLIWYPLLQRPESRRFTARLKKIVNQEWLDVTLNISQPVPDGFGFAASGMFIINPPWKLAEALHESLPYLVSALKRDDAAGFTLETGSSKQ